MVDNSQANSLSPADERSGAYWTDGCSPVQLDVSGMPRPKFAGYTPMQRWQAAMVWSITGNAEEVARQTGCDSSQVCKWIREEPEWWVRLLADVARVRSRELDGRLTAGLMEALEATIDRIRQGDPHVLKSGQVIRKPINALAAATTFAILYDKRQLGRGQATSRVERVNLGELRAKFARVIEGDKAEGFAEGTNDKPHTLGDSGT